MSTYNLRILFCHEDKLRLLIKSALLSAYNKYPQLIFLHKDINYGYSLEVPHWNTSDEYSQLKLS